MTRYNKRYKKENSENEPEIVDDSLTNLQWLTGVNLDDILTGKPIKCSSHSEDDGCDVGRARRCLSESSEYRREWDIKPPYSYAVLIIMAMKSKATNKMTLREIYEWISDNFVFYRHAEPTWKNSIRHNLSLNKCFEKIPRKKGEPGKGGYWSIVPEFANKILENNIRKRCSRVYDYDGDNIMRHLRRRQRQRLDVLQTMLSCKIKTEIAHDSGDEEKITTSVDVVALEDRGDTNQPVGIFANLEHCRMDHPYGKNPVVNYNESDEDNIRAIASHLIETTSNVDVSIDTDEENTSCLPTMNSIFNSFANAHGVDCMWSSEHNNNLAESMSKITKELLEARNICITESPLLNTASSGDLTSTPKADDDEFCDDLDSIHDLQENFDDEDIKYLMVRGTKATLFPSSRGDVVQLNENSRALVAMVS